MYRTTLPAAVLALGLLVLPSPAPANDRATAELIRTTLNEGGTVTPELVEKSLHRTGDESWSVARFCIRQVSRLNPLDSRYPFLMGCTLLHLGQGDEAMKFIDEAIAAAPTSPEPVNLKAEYLRGLGDEEGYLAALRQSLALDGAQRKVHHRLCRALLSRGAPGDEAEAFTHAAAAAGNSPAMTERLARLFGDRERRYALLDRAAEIRTERALRKLHAEGGSRGPARFSVSDEAAGTAASSALPSPTSSPSSPPSPSSENTVTRPTGTLDTGHTGRYSTKGDQFMYVDSQTRRAQQRQATRESRTTPGIGLHR